MRVHFLLLSILVLAACASNPKLSRDPAGREGRVRLAKTGELCRLNLDGDDDPDTIEITRVGKSRVLVVTHSSGKRAKALLEEPLTRQQSVECVSNHEPGVQMQGTDDGDKAVCVSLINDYFKVEKTDAGSKLLYFDRGTKTYKWLWQAD
jgi:hypothetical protein